MQSCTPAVDSEFLGTFSSFWCLFLIKEINGFYTFERSLHPDHKKKHKYHNAIMFVFHQFFWDRIMFLRWGSVAKLAMWHERGWTATARPWPTGRLALLHWDLASVPNFWMGWWVYWNRIDWCPLFMDGFMMFMSFYVCSLDLGSLVHLPIISPTSLHCPRSQRRLAPDFTCPAAWDDIIKQPRVDMMSRIYHDISWLEYKFMVTVWLMVLRNDILCQILPNHIKQYQIHSFPQSNQRSSRICVSETWGSSVILPNSSSMCLVLSPNISVEKSPRSRLGHVLGTQLSSHRESLGYLSQMERSPPSAELMENCSPFTWKKSWETSP